MTAPARRPERQAPGLPPKVARRAPEGSGEQVGSEARPKLRRLSLLGILAVIVLVSFVYCQIQISQTAVERVEAEARVAAEAVDIERLRTHVAHLQSPGRIMAEATRLGLVTPDTVEFLPVPSVDTR